MRTTLKTCVERIKLFPKVATPPTPVDGDFRLLETGDYRLLESGDFRLLE